MERTTRQHPRYNAALPVELHALGVPTPLRAQTHDICLGGFYVELTYTQPVSTELEIAFWIGETKILASGVVVSNHPSFGNGIKFTDVAAE
jgi:hypothetical protein